MVITMSLWMGLGRPLRLKGRMASVPPATLGHDHTAAGPAAGRTARTDRVLPRAAGPERSSKDAFKSSSLMYGRRSSATSMRLVFSSGQTKAGSGARAPPTQSL